MKQYIPELHEGHLGTRAYYALQWKEPDDPSWITYIHAPPDADLNVWREWFSNAFHSSVETRIVRVDESREIVPVSG